MEGGFISAEQIKGESGYTVELLWRNEYPDGSIRYTVAVNGDRFEDTASGVAAFLSRMPERSRRNVNFAVVNRGAFAPGVAEICAISHSAIVVLFCWRGFP
jgi:hypothetical protein